MKCAHSYRLVISVFAILVPVLNCGKYSQAQEADTSSLSQETRAVLSEIAETQGKNEIRIDAYLSPLAPESFVGPIAAVRSILSDFDDAGAKAIAVNVHDTVPYTKSAIAALENGVLPIGVIPAEPGRSSGALCILRSDCQFR